MAEPEMEEDLFADLYDGEADDPTPANPVKAEPEAAQVQPQNDSVEPAQAKQEEDDGDDFNIKTEMDTGAGFGSMPGMNVDMKPEGAYGGTPAHVEDERPISMKDDG